MDDPRSTPPSPPPPATPPATPPPSRWSGVEYTIGLVATLPVIFVLGAMLNAFGILAGLGAVLGVGLWLGIGQRRWGGFLGSITCLVAVPLIVFVICLINPPNFH